jgi:hypothetical protein
MKAGLGTSIYAAARRGPSGATRRETSRRISERMEAYVYQEQDNTHGGNYCRHTGRMRRSRRVLDWRQSAIFQQRPHRLFTRRCHRGDGLLSVYAHARLATYEMIKGVLLARGAKGSSNPFDLPAVASSRWLHAIAPCSITVRP